MKCIVPASTRYKISQFILRLLYGYKNMYIAPWKHSALSVDAILIHEGKLFLAKRAEHLEYPGFWHVPAGHVNIGRTQY